MYIKGKYIGHCCLFSPWCWKMYREYGTPMRLHIGKRFCTILSGEKRSKKIWKQNTYYQRDSDSDQWYKFEREDENSEWTKTPCVNPLGLKN